MEIARELQGSFVVERNAELRAEEAVRGPEEAPEGCFFVGQGRNRRAERFDAEELDLSYRWLQAVPPELERCTRLRRLVLCSNYIQRIEHLPPQLEELVLGVNDQVQRLENLPAGLRVLELCGAGAVTRIENLPADLRSLRLVECGLTSLENLPEGLEKLNVSTNSIRSLDGLPDSLRCLNVENNRIATIERLPPGLQRLRLHQRPSPLSTCPDNPISTLPPLPPTLRRLRTTIDSPLVEEVNSGRWAASHGQPEDVSDFSDGDISYTVLPDGSVEVRFDGADSSAEHSDEKSGGSTESESDSASAE